MLARSLLAIACIFLGACSEHDKIKSDLERLADRLQSFTGIPLAANENLIALNPPAKHTLEYPIPRLQIAMRDFFAIDDCPLGQYIAERNTALGKTQLPSTRFIYEKRLLTTLKSCMQQLPQDHPMHAQLQNWISQKNLNLPKVWSNMMTQSDEPYLAFTTAGGYISGQSEDGLQSSKLALNYLAYALRAETIDSNQFELHLRDLRNSRLPARMWRTQQLLSNALPPMTDLLREYIKANANQCDAKQKEALTIMRNIFTLFFADSIQPLASQLNHYQYQLNPSFEALSNDPQLPSAWSAYIRSHYGQAAEQYKADMQAHIEMWQQVFKMCQ
jgi:hypothetical protein